MASISVIFMMVMAVQATISGYCLHGDGDDCVFPCHCAKLEECTTGECTSGCADGALNVAWRGHGCQIGNVALGKRAIHTGNTWPASNGVDGQIATEPTDCAQPYRSSGGLAEWGVDLGDIYKVYSIIIHNRRACCKRRTSMFTITMRNSRLSVNEELCYDYNIDHNPGDVLQFNCTQPVIGRYIRFKRKARGHQTNSMNFCEFIAIGHKYLDCSQMLCAEGALCNDVTGCDFCIGSYQPDCKTVCEDGSYGINCYNACGKCLNNAVCNKTDGNCGADGCLLWFADFRCQSEIVLPERTNETTNAGESKSNTLSVTWIAINSISKNISQFYGYTLFYKESNDGDYIKGPDVPHEDSNIAVQLSVNIRTPIRQATIENLSLNTEYHVEITPYREMREEREYGTPYPAITQKTRCGAPDKPLIVSNNVDLDYGGKQHNVTIIITPTELINSGCDTLTNIQVEYEHLPSHVLKSVDINTTISNITLTDLIDGKYHIRITITNNENISSTSDSMTVTFSPTTVSEVTTTGIVLGRLDNPSARDMTPVIASLVVVVVVLLVIFIPLTVVLVRRKRRDDIRDTTQATQSTTAHITKNDVSSQPKGASVPLDDIQYATIGDGQGNMEASGNNYYHLDNKTANIYRNQIGTVPYEAIRIKNRRTPTIYKPSDSQRQASTKSDVDTKEVEDETYADIGDNLDHMRAPGADRDYYELNNQASHVYNNEACTGPYGVIRPQQK